MEWFAWGGLVRREVRSGTRAGLRGEAPGGNVSGKSARLPTNARAWIGGDTASRRGARRGIAGDSRTPIDAIEVR